MGPGISGNQIGPNSDIFRGGYQYPQPNYGGFPPQFDPNVGGMPPFFGQEGRNDLHPDLPGMG
jgi:hypothetical protein